MTPTLQMNTAFLETGCTRNYDPFIINFLHPDMAWICSWEQICCFEEVEVHKFPHSKRSPDSCSGCRLYTHLDRTFTHVILKAMYAMLFFVDCNLQWSITMFFECFCWGLNYINRSDFLKVQRNFGSAFWKIQRSANMGPKDLGKHMNTINYHISF